MATHPLYTFLGQADGALPNEVSLDPADNLYGTTINGGSSNCAGGGCGVAFKIDTRGRETLLHTFTATGSDGYNPGAGLLRDSSGILYGTTYLGGANRQGVLFKLTPQSEGMRISTLPLERNHPAQLSAPVEMGLTLHGR